MKNDIAFFGDPHGNFDPLKEIGRLPDGELPAAVVMMGDFDAARSLYLEADESLQGRVPWSFIHGNHDADSEEWHDRVFDERSAAHNISCRVVELPNGIRVAGLGGVFRSRIWNPRDGEGVQHYLSRQDWIYKNGHQHRWRKGIPLRHRDSIFPEDFEVLADLKADVLVTHEAPSCMKLPRADGSWEEVGFKELDELAEIMGVKAIVHGHHHHQYDAKLDNGILVFGTAKATMRRLSPRQLGLQKQIWIGANMNDNRYPAFEPRKHESVGKIDVKKFCQESHPKVRCVGADIGGGWSDLVADYIEKVSAVLSKPGVPEDATYQIRDIKEKFGSIRIYGSLYGIDDDELRKEIADEIEKFEDVAEDLSETVCDCCGGPGEAYKQGGWVMTRCEDHAQGEPVKKPAGPSM